MKKFEGWYFKHQAGGRMLSLIPGRAGTGDFVQVIWDRGTKNFSVPSVEVQEGVIRAGNCRFSAQGCIIDLPGVQGEIVYEGWTPLKTDIMGPFRFLPMECRHGVLSMDHSLRGQVEVDGERLEFTGGRGYAEMDRGISFPRGYQWVQCNSFPEAACLMAAVAAIPFCGFSFQGCICAFVFRGREYRFATYRGVRIAAAEENHICLHQGRFCLDIATAPASPGQPLAAPVKGAMSAIIRESCNARVRVRLWERTRLVCDLESSAAACEFQPEENPDS